MIFVCVGSRDYQFDRLIKEVDQLVGLGKIKDKVFAQIGATNYKPQFIEYVRYLSFKEFENMQSKADLIISHAGTGSLVSALKKGKRTIAVPRLSKFGEHIDDHQIQIADVLHEGGYLMKVLDIKKLDETIKEIKTKSCFHKFNSQSEVYNIIIDFIEKHYEK